MKDYIFVLGRDVELSLLEIESYLVARKIKYNIKYWKENIALISTDNIHPQKMISDLGGTVKIGEVISDDYNFESKLQELLLNINSEKINYYLSSYNNVQSLEKINNFIKDILRKNEIKFNCKIFININSPKKINLSENSIDFIIFSKYLGRTITLSEPESYKKYEKRPENDFLKSTSVRLSKILLNLAQSKPGYTVLDPFCGIGSILQQAIILDMDVIGIDLDKKSSFQAKQNLEWTNKTFKKNKKIQIINGDSSNILNILRNTNYSSIVTEPYLGPYIKNTLSLKQAEKITNDLETLYTRFFNSLYHLKKDCLIVILLPVFRTKEKKIVELNINKILHSNYIIYSPSKIIKTPLNYNGINKKILRKIYLIKTKFH